MPPTFSLAGSPAVPLSSSPTPAIKNEIYNCLKNHSNSRLRSVKTGTRNELLLAVCGKRNKKFEFKNRKVYNFCFDCKFLNYSSFLRAAPTTCGIHFKGEGVINITIISALRSFANYVINKIGISSRSTRQTMSKYTRVLYF